MRRAALPVEARCYGLDYPFASATLLHTRAAAYAETGIGRMRLTVRCVFVATVPSIYCLLHV